MCKNKSTQSILFSLIVATSAAASAQSQSGDRPEILTLFTTPQERALIDNNRYRISSKKVEATVKQAEPQQPQKKVIMEDVILTLKLNGVSLNKSGQSIAWLNGQAYENGGKLEDGSTIYIKGVLNAQVKIKTPDGKFHSLVTGESSEIKYQKAVEG